MSGIAALAVKEAVASGIGANLLPAIAPSAAEGFAVGALLSGACLLLVLVPRRMRRRRPSASAARRASEVHAAERSDKSEYSPAPTMASPFADESAEVLMPYPVREEYSQVPEGGYGNPPSKQRLAHPELAERRSETRRGHGRHAATSAKAASRKADKLVAARD